MLLEWSSPHWDKCGWREAVLCDWVLGIFQVRLGIQAVNFVLLEPWLQGSLLQLCTLGRVFLNLNSYYFESLSFPSRGMHPFFCIALLQGHAHVQVRVQPGNTFRLFKTEILMQEMYYTWWKRLRNQPEKWQSTQRLLTTGSWVPSLGGGEDRGRRVLLEFLCHQKKLEDFSAKAEREGKKYSGFSQLLPFNSQ